MLRIDIPQRGIIELQHAVFDINGTLAVDGVASPEVGARLQRISEQLSIHILTAGTHGNLPELERVLGFPFHLVEKGDEKMRYVQQLGPMNVIAFGNGNNDVGMLRLAAIGVAVMQGADIVARSPLDALDLLLKPKRIIATLRG